MGSPAGPGFPSSRKALRLHSAPCFEARATVGRRPKARAAGSGRELLAAARAPRGDYFAAAHRRGAGAKAMTALAHQLAGLIGPLHLWSPNPFARENDRSAARFPRTKTSFPQEPLRPSGEAGKYYCSVRRFKPGLCRARGEKSIAARRIAACCGRLTSEG